MKGLPRFIKARKYEKNGNNWVLHQKYRFIRSENIFAFHHTDDYWVLHWYGPWKSALSAVHYFLVDNPAYDRYFTQYERQAGRSRQVTTEEVDDQVADLISLDGQNEESKKKKKKVYHYDKA